MAQPLTVHLRLTPHPRNVVVTACHHVLTGRNWTDDPQAVNCQKCISQMDLQPA